MTRYQHILLATDLGEASQKATEKAKDFAELFGATLSIVHIIEPIAAYGYPELADLQTPLIETANVKMKTLGEKLGVPAERRFVELGSIKKLIPALAAQHKVDLIILGSHDRHGIARLLGSNANAIAHHTHCDTMIVHNTH
ncbi:MAG: UspA [Gammaproteobacteria bacterium]|jgi:universal stress protein A|nr:UspA [Gammaproteobacteria bacterium]